MEIGSFTGLTNTVSQETVPAGGLVKALNVDIDDTGHIRRRRGTKQLASGNHHSLFRAADGTIFVVKDGTLCRLNANLDAVPMRSGVGVEKLHYVQVGDQIYAKSASQALTFNTRGEVSDWGVPHVPMFYVLRGDGILPAGQYQVAVTYVRQSDGLEGGVSEVRLFELFDQGGIFVTGIPELPGYLANIYIAAPGGDILYLACTRVGTQAIISSAPHRLGSPLRSVGKYPPTGKGPLAKSFGRIYVAEGHILWATDPGQFEQITRATGYKIMEGRITFLASVAEGVYIGTESGVFFMKGEFENAKLIRVSSQGAPDQTPQDIDVAYVTKGDHQGVGVMYLTDGGICVGLSDGNVLSLTSDNFEFPKATDVAVMYRRQDGLNQFVGVSSHPGTPTGSARFGDFVDAEIIRHKGV